MNRSLMSKAGLRDHTVALDKELPDTLFSVLSKAPEVV
jgi:hypothetical protein